MSKTDAVFRFYDYQPEPADFLAEVTQGLRSQPRRIAPKFFYDEEGSHLFDAICETSEYYITRTELDIIRQNKDEIAGYIGSNCLLIEPGSGNSRKVRELLDSVQPHAYFPMDISSSYLNQEAKKVASEFPWLHVHAICADFTAPIDLPYTPNGPHRVAFFPGSSVGNFEPEDAVGFLGNVAAMVQQGGGLLIGVDLKKDPTLLNAAYNDTQGATAAFNTNLLTRINRDLSANFDVGKFRHNAFYNEAAGRVEMHLICKAQRQQVNIKGQCFDFHEGESIHTENSYKYTAKEFQDLAKRAGFSPVKVWMDKNEYFSVHYFEVGISP